MTEIHGYTAPGFDAVRDAFAANFANHGEVGAGFSAFHKGKLVADLWGGIADVDSGRTWDEDTLILVFSTTKGATAMCANRLAQQGLLDVDATVATYWPEFAAHGKATITVQHLLSHQAGLAWVDGAMTLDEALAWDPVIRALEAQTPSWEPGTQHGYHATTYGWLVGEVVRRISGKTIGAYLQDEIAGPLGAEFYIGLPAEHQHRAATLISMLPKGLSFTDEEASKANGVDPGVRDMLKQFMGPDTILGKALTAPGGALSDMESFNLPKTRGAEIPAAAGVANAKGIATLYGACVSEVGGRRVLEPKQLNDAITQRTSGGNTVLFDMDIQFGLGFMVRSSLMPIGGPRSFGHFGMGGSMGWADPDAELGFGYVMNKMDLGLAGDARSSSLVNAVYASL